MRWPCARLFSIKFAFPLHVVWSRRRWFLSVKRCRRQRWKVMTLAFDVCRPYHLSHSVSRVPHPVSFYRACHYVRANDSHPMQLLCSPWFPPQSLCLPARLVSGPCLPTKPGVCTLVSGHCTSEEGRAYKFVNKENKTKSKSACKLLQSTLLSLPPCVLGDAWPVHSVVLGLWVCEQIHQVLLECTKRIVLTQRKDESALAFPETCASDLERRRGSVELKVTQLNNIL